MGDNGGTAAVSVTGGTNDPGWSSDSDDFDRPEYSDRLFSSSQGSACTYVSASSSGGGGDEPPPANTKRAQRTRITTEAHQKTVAMIMAASRELWTQPPQPVAVTGEHEAGQRQLQQLQHEPCCVFQRAYW